MHISEVGYRNTRIHNIKTQICWQRSELFMTHIHSWYFYVCSRAV